MPHKRRSYVMVKLAKALLGRAAKDASRAMLSFVVREPQDACRGVL